ncbi:MAG: hypothetical protein MK102_02940 [Fuerstiella sp.]|nr:hypothetical protein [Fuerstiella sp.]
MNIFVIRNSGIRDLDSLHIIPVAAAFGLCVVLTPIIRSFSRRCSLVAQPSEDRWHQTPTALCGGIAIFGSVMVVSFVAGPDGFQFRSILAAGSLLFIVGLIDDLRSIKPYQKLIAQILAASIVCVSGVILPWTPFPPINMALTILWLVGITNAVNLLDNMDGLAAGISAIAGSFLTANLLINGQIAESVAVASFVAALIGFLVYNFNPASIFMGDCGSMFLGFFLAGTSMLSITGGRLQSLPVLVVPVLVLLIPIFDTTLVAIVRRMSGRAISQGGRDHASHRLVALGLSERRAVLMLYGLAVVSGCLGLAVRWLPIDTAVASVIGLTIILSLVGIYLAQVSVYDASEVAEARRQPLVAFLIDLSYKRRVFEVLLDAVLVLMSWYVASLILFGRATLNEGWGELVHFAPLLLAVKLPVLLMMGVYRGLWRYIGLDSVLTYGKAVAASSVGIALALLLIYRFEGFSRTVLVLDAVVLFTCLTTSRFMFRLLRRVLPGGDVAFGRPESKRVLIYGAGDGGELLVRELRNNLRWGCHPIGFVDDDRLKINKVIHGLRVLGGNDDLVEICERQNVDEVLVSSTHISDGRVMEVSEECGRHGIALRRMRFHLEPISTLPDDSLIGAYASSDGGADDDVNDRWKTVPR